MNAWLNRFPLSVPESLRTPEEAARLELAHALPDCSVTLESVPAMGDGFCLFREKSGYRIAGGPGTAPGA